MLSQCPLRRHVVYKQSRNCDLTKKFLMFYETCATVCIHAPGYCFIQELSYHKQIAHQRVQYDEGNYNPKI